MFVFVVCSLTSFVNTYTDSLRSCVSVLRAYVYLRMLPIVIFIASLTLGTSCGAGLPTTAKLRLVNQAAAQLYQRVVARTSILSAEQQYRNCLAKSMTMTPVEYATLLKYSHDRQNPQLFVELGLSFEVGAFVVPIWFKFCIDQQNCATRSKGKNIQLTESARQEVFQLERFALTAQQPAVFAATENFVNKGFTGGGMATLQFAQPTGRTEVSADVVDEWIEEFFGQDEADDVVENWIAEYFAETEDFDDVPPVVPPPVAGVPHAVTGELSLFEHVRVAAALAINPSISSGSIAQKLGRAVDDPLVANVHRTFALTLCMPRLPYESYMRTGNVLDVFKEFPYMELSHLNFWFSMPQTEIQYQPIQNIYVFPPPQRVIGFEAVTAIVQIKYEASLIGDLSDAQKLIDLDNPDTDFYRFTSAAFTMNTFVHALLQDSFVPFERVMVACIERTGNPLACTFNGLDIWRRFCIQRNLCAQTSNPEIWTLTSEGIAQYLEYVSQQLRPLDFGITIEQSIRVCDALLIKSLSRIATRDHDYAQFLLSLREIPVVAYELLTAHATRSNPRFMNLFYEYAPTVPIGWGTHIVDTWLRLSPKMCARERTWMRLTPSGFYASITWYKQKLQTQLASTLWEGVVPPTVAKMIGASSTRPRSKARASIGDSICCCIVFESFIGTIASII